MTATGIPEGNYVDISGGLQLHYHDVGEGTPIVFVHGSGPGASGYSNFKQNYFHFAEAGYRCIVPDLVGFGYSSKPEGRDYELDFFVSTLKELLDHLEIQKCVLVGNSLGGAVSIKMALDHPDLVEKLIMMAPGGIESKEAYFKMPGIQRMVTEFVGGTLDQEGLGALLSMLVFDPRHVTPCLIEERFGVLQTQPADVLSRMSVPDMGERLGELICPILGFWGTEDQFCPATGAQKFLKQCKKTRFIEVTECGHWVMVEFADMFNKACLDFLAE